MNNIILITRFRIRLQAAVFNLLLTLTWDSVHISPILLLDLNNCGSR